jgi:hypothetical protein
VPDLSRSERARPSEYVPQQARAGREIPQGTSSRTTSSGSSMPGRVQSVARPRSLPPSSITKHHSGRMQPASNMLRTYCRTSSRWQAAPPASTKPSS